LSCPDCGAQPWEHHRPASDKALVVRITRDLKYPTGLVLKKGSYLTVEVRPGDRHFTFARPSSDGQSQEFYGVLLADAQICRTLLPSRSFSHS